MLARESYLVGNMLDRGVSGQTAPWKHDETCEGLGRFKRNIRNRIEVQFLRLGIDLGVDLQWEDTELCLVTLRLVSWCNISDFRCERDTT